MNQTVSPPSLQAIHLPQFDSTPFYYSHKPTLLDDIPDTYLALAAPVLAYWSLSLFFHYLDMSEWKWLEKYRIHDSSEVKSRNLATRTQVVQAVLFQQLLQTLLGLVWLEEESSELPKHAQNMESIARWILPALGGTVGDKWGVAALGDLTYFVYWWAIPIFQLFLAMFFIDTWQYFLHRWMHVNKFMYRHFHSWHHRLYVPYAFGSLYNHPVEGLILDSLGSVLAESFSFMSTRQAMFLFTLSTFKTVDDHCGYRLPFDPLQLATSNNADYHDIHHQVIGIKSNFSQPFFVHWDVLLGTRMTRQDIAVRRQRYEGKKTS